MRDVTTRLRDRLLPVAATIHPTEWGDRADTILIFQPDHLGDILLSQPAVRYLRDIHPTSRLVAVVGPWSNEIARMSWPVDDVVNVAFPGFDRSTHQKPWVPYRQLLDEARCLRHYHASTAYVLRPDAWWAAWLASLVAPVVVTSADARARPFSTTAVPVSDRDHASLRAYTIATRAQPTTPLDPTESPLGTTVSAEAEREAQPLIGGAERYVVLHPGSGAPVKEWAVHRWIAVANWLSDRGWRVVLTGSASEAPLCASISSATTGARSIAGLTSVRVLAEVMRGADVVVGPDCGPLHLAVAVGTPSVHLFGPSDPARYGPFGPRERHCIIRADWACDSCGDLSPTRSAGCGCMLAIQPQDVTSAIESLVAADVR